MLKNVNIVKKKQHLLVGIKDIKKHAILKSVKQIKGLKEQLILILKDIM